VMFKRLAFETGPGRGFGPRGPWAFQWGRFRQDFSGPWASFRPRARRGDVRAAILALLAERPRHGYEVIQELEARSGGAWRVSPGSVYPTLQMLEDEGLVAGSEVEGKRVYALTEAGRAEVARRQEAGSQPWDEVAGGADRTIGSLREAAFQLGAAAFQVARAGSREQVQRTVEVLAEARRQIYGILAQDQDQGQDQGQA